MRAEPSERFPAQAGALSQGFAPSIGMTVPVMCPARSSASHRTKSATSAGFSHFEKSAPGHGFAVCGRVHRAGKNHVGGESRVLVFQRHRANKTGERGLECDV